MLSKLWPQSGPKRTKLECTVLIRAYCQDPRVFAPCDSVHARDLQLLCSLALFASQINVGGGRELPRAGESEVFGGPWC